VTESGLLEYYKSRPQDLERADNLQEFVSAAEQFRKDEEDEDALTAFLANAALESGEADGEVIEAAVNLMTVHAAKGLEFATVFVTGLEDGTFPHSRSLESRKTSDLEEERRLMYVAITRAKEELFLSFAESRMQFGNKERMPSSRFLDELPPNLLEVESAFPAMLDFVEKPRRSRGRPKGSGKAKPKTKAAASMEPPKIHSRIAADDNPGYRPGAGVKHPKYGSGVVTRREGRGDNLKVEVAFKRAGVRTFILAQSPLSLS